MPREPSSCPDLAQLFEMTPFTRDSSQLNTRNVEKNCEGARAKMLVPVVLKYAVFCTALFVLYTVVRTFLERQYYLSLPMNLKNNRGAFNFSKRIMRRATRAHGALIKSASSKMVRGRSTKAILQNPEIRDYLEKYIHLYHDEFADEIFYEKLEMRHENTRMFFNLLNHKFRASQRNLVKAILYVIEEEHYFNFRESILLSKPRTYKDLIVQCVKYMIMHGRTDLDSFYVKRLAYSLNLNVSLVSVPALLVRAKRELEMKQFDKDFSKSQERMLAGTTDRLRNASTEEFMDLAAKQGLDVSESSYNTVPEDFTPQSKVDHFYNTHLKYSLVQHFENQCVCCEKSKAVSLVHFWKPKKEGGNLAMKSKQGQYVNNCIPMCKECLAEMGEKTPKEFFGRTRLEALLVRSWEFNTLLNTRMAQLEAQTFNPSLLKKAA